MCTKILDFLFEIRKLLRETGVFILLKALLEELTTRRMKEDAMLYVKLHSPLTNHLRMLSPDMLQKRLSLGQTEGRFSSESKSEVTKKSFSKAKYSNLEKQG